MQINGLFVEYVLYGRCTHRQHPKGLGCIASFINALEVGVLHGAHGIIDKFA